MTEAFRHPVLAVSHGPGPLWLFADGPNGKTSKAANNIRNLFKFAYPGEVRLPKRILFLSAHHESEDRDAFEISVSKKPEMVYDYYGFPPEAYAVKYPASGDPDFAVELQGQLNKNGLKANLVERGFDHGLFVVMLLMRPEADIPIVTLSINDVMDAKTHFKLGQAIAPFRGQDTLIICSGEATHNLRAGLVFGQPVSDWAGGFQDWIDDTFTDRTTLSYAERQAAIENWRKVPSARTAHPSPDHFTPFVVAAGAGMEENAPSATKLFGGWGGQLSLATYAYGV